MRTEGKQKRLKEERERGGLHEKNSSWELIILLSVLIRLWHVDITVCMMGIFSRSTSHHCIRGK